MIRLARICTTLAVAALIRVAMAQQPSPLSAALGDLGSPDPYARVRAFDKLLALTRPASGTIPSQVSALMARNPEQAGQIKTALIAALNRDAVYVRSLEASGARMTEAFSDYWSNLMWTVAGFRDPRAIAGLLAGVVTGEIAVNGLADLCPSSVDALVAESTSPQASARRRASAVIALGECTKRLQAMPSSGPAAAKARQASLNATHDPDPQVRKAAASVLAGARHR